MCHFMVTFSFLSIGTGDLVLDMENQVKANNVRIELLEKQNEGLRNSITKLMTVQQPAPQQPQWATYVRVCHGNVFA